MLILSVEVSLKCILADVNSAGYNLLAMIMFEVILKNISVFDKIQSLERQKTLNSIQL